MIINLSYDQKQNTNESMTFFFQNLWRRNIEISPILIIINIIIIIVMAKEFSEYFHLALKLIFYFSCNKLMLVIY